MGVEEDSENTKSYGLSEVMAYERYGLRGVLLYDADGRTRSWRVMMRALASVVNSRSSNEVMRDDCSLRALSSSAR